MNKIKHYIELARYFYKNFGFWTVLYLLFIEFPLCVLYVGFVYRLKVVMYGQDPVVSVNGSLMKLDLSDIGASKELFIFGVREPTSTLLTRKLVKKTDIVMDIGANIGYYALPECMYACDGHVYAIEPVQDNYDSLCRNIKLNGYRNITPVKCAISDVDGHVNIVVPEKKNLSFIPQHIESRPLHGYETKMEIVPMYTLDSFCKQGIHPSYVRMDVEGHEINILRGMTNVLHSMPVGSWMFIEIHLRELGKGLTKELYNILEGAGFVERYCVKEGKNPKRFNYTHLRELFPGLCFPSPIYTESFFKKVK